MKLRILALALAGSLLTSLATAAIFVVDSVGDEPDADTSDGLCKTALMTCTLRAAIEQANALAGADVIQFNILGTGVHTIAPASPLPFLTDDAGLTIDGYTQPGSSPNSATVGDNAVLLIEIDGSNAGSSAVGFRILAAHSLIRGLVMNSFGRTPISIEAGFGHQVFGCFLGTDPSGQIARPNSTGIIVDFFAPAELESRSVGRPLTAEIGSSNAADRNLVSGNSNGIFVFSVTGVSISGNYVGVDASGAVAVSNAGTGIQLTLTDATAQGNLVSGNGLGIVVDAGANYIAGNLVGSDATGTHPIPNASGITFILATGGTISQNTIVANTFDGIHIMSSTGVFIASNTIGAGSGMGNGRNGILVNGSSAMVAIGYTPNVISFNGGSGVQVGISPTDVPEGILIAGNSIHDNALLGIDLGGDGVSPNNDCDGGRGPNLGQNSPVIDFAGPVAGGTRVAGSLNSVPGFQYFLDFYSSPACDPSGFGEGQTYIGTLAVMTPSLECVVGFDTVLPQTVPVGSIVTATATDAAHNTSEFSACRPLSVGQQFYTLPPCRIADTRDPNGPYGGPALGIASDRTFVIAGQCGVPADAQAVALNVAVTQPTNVGHLILFASGTPVPVPPAVNYSAGQTRARDGIFALGLGSGLDAHVNQTAGTVHLVLDVTGYLR